RVVFGGLMQVSCTPIAPADIPWYDATKVPCTPYDPADAKRLVAASGLTNPSIRLLTTNPTDLVRVAQFVQAQEAVVGINVAIDIADSATANARTNGGDFDVRLNSLAPGQVDPGTGIYRRLATQGSTNASGYSSPRLDLILANGLKATDVTARSTLYHV